MSFFLGLFRPFKPSNCLHTELCLTGNPRLPLACLNQLTFEGKTTTKKQVKKSSAVFVNLFDNSVDSQGMLL